MTIARLDLEPGLSERGFSIQETRLSATFITHALNLKVWYFLVTDALIETPTTDRLIRTRVIHQHMPVVFHIRNFTISAFWALSFSEHAEHWT